MSLLDRFARFVAPLPVTTTHLINPTLPPAQFETVVCIGQHPSEGIQAKTVVSQSFPPPSVYRIANGILAANTPVSSDLLFSISSTSVVSLFAPLTSYAFAAELPELHATWISWNLFERLNAPGVIGADYTARMRKKPSAEVQPARSIDQSGFKKAYSRIKTLHGTSTHTVLTLSIWDLIYPSLLPPIPVEFAPDVDVLHRLRPYQQVGVKFLVEHGSALLGDDMGTGKTVMTVVALRVLFQIGKATKALIVCPVSVLKVWQDHLRDWAPELSFTVVRGTREERKLDWKYPAHVYVAAYDTVASDFLTVVKKKTKITCKTCKRTAVFGEKVHLSDDEVPQFKCGYCGTPFEELQASESLVDNGVISRQGRRGAKIRRKRNKRHNDAVCSAEPSSGAVDPS